MFLLFFLYFYRLKSCQNTTKMSPKHPQSPPKNTPKHPPKHSQHAPKTPKKNRLKILKSHIFNQSLGLFNIGNDDNDNHSLQL